MPSLAHGTDAIQEFLKLDVNKKMMNKLKTLRAAIYTLGAIGIVATLMMAGQGAWTRASMSDDANKVFDSKDLVADILPPPMYLIETRVILSEALEGLISPAELKTRFDKLSKEYDDRVEYWTKHPPYGLERLLLGHQHEAAKNTWPRLKLRLWTKWLLAISKAPWAACPRCTPSM